MSDRLPAWKARLHLLTAGEVAALDTIAGKVIAHLAGEVPAGLPPR